MIQIVHTRPSSTFKRLSAFDFDNFEPLVPAVRMNLTQFGVLLCTRGNQVDDVVVSDRGNIQIVNVVFVD